MTGSWVDYIIFLIFVFTIISGFVQGFVSKVIGLLTLVTAFIVATTFASALANVFMSHEMMQGFLSKITNTVGSGATQTLTYIAIGLSFGLLFAATSLIGSMLGYLFSAAFQSGILGLGNRVLGMCFGFVQGYLINLVIIFLVQFTPFSTSTAWQKSALVPGFQPAVTWLGEIVSPAIADLKKKLGTKLEDVNSSLKDITR